MEENTPTMPSVAFLKHLNYTGEDVDRQGTGLCGSKRAGGQNHSRHALLRGARRSLSQAPEGD